MQQAEEYARIKAFLSFYSDRYLDLETVPPENRPIACLEALERRGKKIAIIGLRQAINDCIESSLYLNHAEVARFDSELSARGIITLSELRRRYSKGYARIMKQGKIKNETEYYLIRNVLGDPTEKTLEERELLEKILSDYAGT